jgi:hypothetical protein
MKIDRIVEEGMTRTFWFHEPVFECVETWANRNILLNRQHCDHQVCTSRVTRLLRINGVFYVGPGRAYEQPVPQAVHVTLTKEAQWSDVEPEVMRLMKTFEPVA